MISRMISLFLGLTLLGCPFALASEPAAPAEEMTLLSINVRKADAHLLHCGSSAYLIDTGTKKSFDALYRVLRDNGVDRLTGVILTHSHSDHTGGLKKLMASDIGLMDSIKGCLIWLAFIDNGDGSISFRLPSDNLREFVSFYGSAMYEVVPVGAVLGVFDISVVIIYSS